MKKNRRQERRKEGATLLVYYPKSADLVPKNIRILGQIVKTCPGRLNTLHPKTF